MKRTVIYGRVSTEDQLERYGLPVQLRACQEYAAKNGLNVVTEITDDGISGVIIDRPGLNKIREMARRGEIDTVLMLDVDRLSRELAHLLILKPELESKASLEFVAAKFEDSPSGRMFFGIRGVISQYERELTRERTMRGRKERARAGLIVGGRVAYGYRYEGGRLTEDPERAPIARRIFADYEAGASARGIAEALRQSGIPTSRGANWGKSSVSRILTNETYAGVAHYGTHRREGKLLRLRDNPAERIAVTVPAIVSREQWERVQARMAENPQTGRPSANYLLRGVLFCSHCGRKMSSDGGRDIAYRCSGRDRLRITGEACRNRARGPVLDAAAWRGLTRSFTDEAFLRAAYASRETELRNVDPAKIDDLRKLALKLKRREEAALSAMLDPDLSEGRQSIKAQYKSLGEARRKAEIELSNMEIARGTAPDSDWVDEAAGTVSRFVKSVVDPKLKQEFVRRLVNRAEWNGKEIRMVCLLSRNWAQRTDVVANYQHLQVVVIERVAA